MLGSQAPVFLILTGATANESRIAACQELAREHWPGADVRMPNYLSRFRGVRDVGHWLERWMLRNLAGADSVFVLAFVLGGAALPYAPLLCSRIKRMVILRSRFQEALPRALRAWFGRWGAALLFGKAVSDLGRGPLWPLGFHLPCPTLVLVETRPTLLASRLRVSPLADDVLHISTYQELPIDHDYAYRSPLLMETATSWLRRKDA
jgi:hypothetical protein